MDPLVREAYASIGLPKPFIKWVGGKRQLLPKLLSLLPPKFDYYYEPFLGGGALYFEMWRLGLLDDTICHLSDLNEELINAYEAMRDAHERLITRLKCWPAGDRVGCRGFFNSMRKKQPHQYTPISAAARFIYLNRTCFNGLYRVNRKGEFNVPFGKYKNPQLYNEENFHAVSEALRLAHLWCGDFQQLLGHIGARRAKKSFIYMDPPYVPRSTTSDFTAYTDVGFILARQEELAAICETLDKQGAKWMLSNSNVAWVRKRYKQFKKHKVHARRNINSDATKRGKIAELIITNY